MPQIGPDVPPIRPVMTIATFCRNVPVSLRSNESHWLEHVLEPAGQREPEVAVADDGVEVPEVLLVLDAAFGDGADDGLDAGIGHGSRSLLGGVQEVLDVRQLDLAVDGEAVGVAQDDGGVVGEVAERADDERRAGEVLVGGVAAHGDDRPQPGAERGAQAVGAVLDDDDLVGADAELLQCEQVDVGGGLLGGHDVPGEHGELRGELGTDGVLEHRADGRLGRRRRDGEPPALRGRLGHDPRDPGPARQDAVGHHRRVVRGLGLVPAGDQVALLVGVGGQVRGLDEHGREHGREAFLAAADREQVPVLLLAPVDREAGLGERLVERGQVAVALGVGQDAVAVEDQRGAHDDAFPAAPNSSMCTAIAACTAAEMSRNIDGGSHLSLARASARCCSAERM